MNARISTLILPGLVMAGCGTMRAYDGPAQSADEVAVVTGDLRFNAGSPLTLILRSVDGKTVDVRYNGVELLPGEHTFIVDCTLRETQSTSRHEVKAELEPGAHYGFTAETAAAMRGCASVDIESR